MRARRCNESLRHVLCPGKFLHPAGVPRYSFWRNASTNAFHRDRRTVPSALQQSLDHIAPRFDLEANAIEILEGPAQFYSELKAKISKAKKRVFLSTLYIGNTENDLVTVISAALRQNSDLHVTFLTDALRGTREAPNPSTASLLAPLITQFGPGRVQIRMYHTPNLTGIRKLLLPKRLNEGWGLQHMKLYGFDDDIILSGANLSKDYFTNRLDRYHVFHSPEITDYYYRAFEAVAAISFDVQPSSDANGFTIVWPLGRTIPSPLQDRRAFISGATALISPILSPPASQASKPSATITSVYPVFQMTPLFSREDFQDKSTDLPSLKTILGHFCHIPASLFFTAGYFNPSPSLVSLLFKCHDSSRTNIIAASPFANGFYNSRGLSGLLPAAYTFLCRRFLQEVEKRHLSRNIHLFEWRRGTSGLTGGWTYHAKGFWLSAAPSECQESLEAVPYITSIGSSNYTKRSYNLDLEANALVVTRDGNLIRRFQGELSRLTADATETRLADLNKTERKVGFHVRLALWITEKLGGAL